MRKIIIVNEDKGLGRLWCKVIKEAGYAVRNFETPDDLYSIIHQDPCEADGVVAVLLDRFFTGGIDLTRNSFLVREIKNLVKGAPVILCSKQHGDADDFSHLPGKEFDDILYPLPVNFDRLLYRLGGAH